MCHYNILIKGVTSMVEGVGQGRLSGACWSPTLFQKALQNFLFMSIKICYVVTLNTGIYHHKCLHMRRQQCRLYIWKILWWLDVWYQRDNMHNPSRYSDFQRKICHKSVRSGSVTNLLGSYIQYTMSLTKAVILLHVEQTAVGTNFLDNYSVTLSFAIFLLPWFTYLHTIINTEQWTSHYLKQ